MDRNTINKNWKRIASDATDAEIGRLVRGYVEQCEEQEWECFTDLAVAGLALVLDDMRVYRDVMDEDEGQAELREQDKAFVSQTLNHFLMEADLRTRQALLNSVDPVELRKWFDTAPIPAPVGTPEPIGLFHTPANSGEIMEWIQKHPKSDQPALTTVFGMTWNMMCSVIGSLQIRNW